MLVSLLASLVSPLLGGGSLRMPPAGHLSCPLQPPAACMHAPTPLVLDTPVKGTTSCSVRARSIKDDVCWLRHRRDSRRWCPSACNHVIADDGIRQFSQDRQLGRNTKSHSTKSRLFLPTVDGAASGPFCCRSFSSKRANSFMAISSSSSRT